MSVTNNHIGGGTLGTTDFNLNSPDYTGNVNDGAALVAALNTRRRGNDDNDNHGYNNDVRHDCQLRPRP